MLRLLAYQGASGRLAAPRLSSQGGAGGAIDIDRVLAGGLNEGMYGIAGGVTLVSGIEQTFDVGSFSTLTEAGAGFFWAKKFCLPMKRRIAWISLFFRRRLRGLLLRNYRAYKKAARNQRPYQHLDSCSYATSISGAWVQVLLAQRSLTTEPAGQSPSWIRAGNRFLQSL